jgi:hypothetical protein
MNERCRGKRVIGSLVPKLARRYLAQLRVHDGQQFVECGLVAAPPFLEKHRDVAWRIHSGALTRYESGLRDLVIETSFAEHVTRKLMESKGVPK